MASMASQHPDMSCAHRLLLQVSPKGGGELCDPVDKPGGLQSNGSAASHCIAPSRSIDLRSCCAGPKQLHVISTDASSTAPMPGGQALHGVRGVLGTGFSEVPNAGSSPLRRLRLHMSLSNAVCEQPQHTHMNASVTFKRCDLGMPIRRPRTTKTEVLG